MTLIKPMLASPAESLEQLPWPLLASYKLDGLRIITTTEGPRMRSLKQVPNRHVRGLLAALPPWLDGELGVVVNGTLDFRASTSAVRREFGEPEVKFFVFDAAINQPERAYFARLRQLGQEALPSWVERLEQREIHEAFEAEAMFAEALAAGHEGLILREPLAGYKYGRSTLREAGMLKLKPWKTAEALVLRIEPEYENTNSAEANELGYAHRSSHAEGKLVKDRAGVIKARNDKLWPKGEFGISGMTDVDKARLWQHRAELEGRAWVRFHYLAATGGYDLPRSAQYEGIRMLEDMGGEDE